MEKPWTIGFSRQGCMDDPIQYEIVYAETNQEAMFKWIKDNPRDIFRTYSIEPSHEEDIKKYGNREVSIEETINLELKKASETFILMNLAKMTVTEINTFTDIQRVFLVEQFSLLADRELASMKEYSKP